MLRFAVDYHLRLEDLPGFVKATMLQVTEYNLHGELEVLDNSSSKVPDIQV